MNDLNNTVSTIDNQTVTKVTDLLKNSKGSIKISFNKNPGLSISLGSNDVRVDVEDPSNFENIGFNSNSNSSGFFDKLKTAQKLLKS